MSDTTLSVMTFNVGNGLVSPANLVAALRQSKAAVVGLQELNAEQANAIERELGDTYPHRVMRGSGFSGRALLSTHPIGASEWVELAPDRPDLRASIHLPGQSLGIVVAHPPPPRPGRRGIVFDPVTATQIAHLGDLTASMPPALLLGDFNMTPRHPYHSRLQAAGLVDAWLEIGGKGGSTFPQRLGKTRRVDHHLSWVPLPSVARVDYIWRTPGIIATAAWVGHAAGSDHRPVMAELVVRGASDER